MRSAHITMFGLLLLMSTGSGLAEPGNSSPTAETASEQAGNSETPQAAAAAIVELLKKEDYKTLILERYSEWERTKNMPDSGSPEDALAKLASGFKRHRDQMIQGYERLVKAEFTIVENAKPQPGETGKKSVAKFSINGREVEVTLYLMESGRWGFHL